MISSAADQLRVGLRGRMCLYEGSRGLCASCYASFRCIRLAQSHPRPGPWSSDTTNCAGRLARRSCGPSPAAAHSTDSELSLSLSILDLPLAFRCGHMLLDLFLDFAVCAAHVQVLLRSSVLSPSSAEHYC